MDEGPTSTAHRSILGGLSKIGSVAGLGIYQESLWNLHLVQFSTHRHYYLCIWFHQMVYWSICLGVPPLPCLCFNTPLQMFFCWDSLSGFNWSLLMDKHWRLRFCTPV